MRRVPLVLLVTAIIAACLPCAAVAARGGRSSRTVQGVRATITQWVGDVLSDDASGACSLLTAQAQRAWATENFAPNCISATKADYRLLKEFPREAAAIRAWANRAPITLRGAAASVPKLSGSGRRTLIYTRGLWYFSS